jgi:DHA2 family multidrug resistance protein
MSDGAASPVAVPGLRRTMVTICAMTATIMQALDTTIANVALPYMQGSLSASQDQINWVLTSYIVAAAIMTAPVGWIANRFGRKRIFIVCSAASRRTSTRWCCSACCRACSAPHWCRCRRR